ncbi:MAG: hypothetical protein HY805_06495 [Nitrospirae bacterium]|nr:hypothetical protein [Nitrospirota bacterium]
MDIAHSLIKSARTVGGDALWELLITQHPEVLSNAVFNKNLKEEMAVFIARSRNTPLETLGFLAGDVRFKESSELKLVLCKNPKTPQKVTLSLLKFIGTLDLGDLTRYQRIPLNIRQKIELILIEKILPMPLGVKKSLAKRASSSVVMAIMGKSDKSVISVCLDSPSLVEGHLYTLINKSSTKQTLIEAVAEHPKWALRYAIRYALIRNFYTPMQYIIDFIKGMKTSDLRLLYSDPKLPVSTKPYIFMELQERNETVDIAKTKTYTLSEEEDACISDRDIDL